MPKAKAATPPAMTRRNGPVKRQCVRLHRRAFAKQTPPIHRNMIVQTMPRSSGRMNAVASIAALGRPHSRTRLRHSPAQSLAVTSCLASRPLTTATAASCLTSLSCFLDRRARNIPIGAEDAAIAGKRLQQRLAMQAVIEELAGIRRHRLSRCLAAVRAGERGYETGHSPNTCISGCSRTKGHIADKMTNSVAKQSMRKVALVGGAVAQLSSAAQARRLRA